MKIFSQVNKDILLVSYIHSEQINEYRNDLSPEGEIMQVSARKLKKGTSVKSHYHLEQIRTTTKTQESWIILSGKLSASIYDIDNTFLEIIILQPGDCIVFFNGGHGLEILEDNTKFYEFKNGPYNGNIKDKQQIQE
jgi:superfamily II DNA/RNA helicase